MLDLRELPLRTMQQVAVGDGTVWLIGWRTGYLADLFLSPQHA
jgi:hypothetical protein